MFYFLKKRLKKAYKKLDPDTQKRAFPSGENEYLFVGACIPIFWGKKKNVLKMTEIYIAAYLFYMTEEGTITKTHRYILDFANGYLNNEDATTLLALAFLTMEANEKTTISDPAATHKYYKELIRSRVGERV